MARMRSSQSLRNHGSFSSAGHLSPHVNVRNVQHEVRSNSHHLSLIFCDPRSRLWLPAPVADCQRLSFPLIITKPGLSMRAVTRIIRQRRMPCFHSPHLQFSLPFPRCRRLYRRHGAAMEHGIGDNTFSSVAGTPPVWFADRPVKRGIFAQLYGGSVHFPGS